MFDFKTVATISTAYGALLIILGLFEASRSGGGIDGTDHHASSSSATGFLGGKEGIRRSRYLGGGAQGGDADLNTVDDSGVTDDLDSVAEMASHAWNGYLRAAKKNARDHGVAYLDTDEVSPLSGKPTSQWGGIAVTAFDSTTTFLTLGMETEFAEAAAIVLEVCDAKFSPHAKGHSGKLRLSVFETTIRHLGSLLSVYSQTQDDRYLSCATRIGYALLEAFDERSGIPFHSVVYGSKPPSRSNDPWTGDRMILAEVGSLQLEFRYLSYFTGNPKFAAAVNQFTEKLILFRSQGWPRNDTHFEPGSNTKNNIPHSGLWPTFINPRDNTVRGSVSFGSLGDSFYEYLLKQWIAFGKQDEHLAELYEDAVEGMLEHVLRYTSRTHYAFLGQISQGDDPRQNHLACFVPGMLTLGVMHGVHSREGRNKGGKKMRKWGNDDVITAAADLTATCYRLYVESPTGLAPEEVIFQDDGSYKVSDSGYYLRPETVESIYYLYRFTGNPQYKNWLETIRHRLDLACRTRDGFASLANTHGSSAEKQDRMETFFLAETLKYLWLGLHGKPDSMPLDRYIFNTEAHPLPIIFDKEIW